MKKALTSAENVKACDDREARATRQIIMYMIPRIKKEYKGCSL